MPCTWVGPDPLERPAHLDERRPLVDDGAVGLDGDHADLQDAVPACGQPGCLEIDDGEVRQCHTLTLDRGYDRPTEHDREGSASDEPE